MTETTATTETDGWEWAIVEIFGHRRHAGRTREEERFGAKMLRIDVPTKGDPAQGVVHALLRRQLDLFVHADRRGQCDARQ